MSDGASFNDVKDYVQAAVTAQVLPVGCVIVPKDYRIASTEEFTSRALRLRGAFHTDLIQDFANYYARNVKADKLGHAPIFIDQISMTAISPLDWMVDDDEPGHKQHVAHCEPLALPDWMALRQAHGAARAQDDMVDMLEDFGGVLTAFDDKGEGMQLSQILAAFRNASISKKSEHAQTLEDASVSRSALESIDANASRRAPSRLTFTLTPYEGFATRTITARVIIRAHGDQPIFTLRVVGMEALIHDIAREFVNLVQSAVTDFYAGDEAPAIYVGRFNWPPIKGV